MKCTNCGFESNSKFCPECGAPMATEPEAPAAAADPQQRTNVQLINGVQVDVAQIVDECGGVKLKHRNKAIQALQKQTKAPIAVAMRYVDDEFAARGIDPTKPTGFWATTAAQGREHLRAQDREKAAELERVKQMDREGTAYCPKCHSTSLSADKKGFGVGKAVVGRALAGNIGLVAGNIGAKKVRITCLKCGHQFWPGK